MIFTSYPNEVKLVSRFLKLLNVPVTISTVNETMQNHPDWPSLLCISDSLNTWNVDNAASKIEADKINELPVPFLAVTKDKASPLVIVTNVADETVEIIQKNNSRPQVISKEQFAKEWDGICLLAEPRSESGEADYKQQKRKEWLSAMLPSAFLILSVIVSFWLLQKNTTSLTEGDTTGIYLQYILMLCGLFVSGLLLWYEIDKNNPLLQKVCTGLARTNCNAILSGNAAKVFSWLSWSEVGFFYFAGGVLSILFFPGNVFTSFLAVLAAPYILFSLYYQWRIARQWCLLCLAVQGLLLLGLVNILFSKMSINVARVDIVQGLLVLFFYLIPVLLWLSVKPVLLRLQELKTNKRNYTRLKFNPQVFYNLLKEQKSISVSTDGLGIVLGKPDAKYELVKVCNPYCGPCAKAHPEIERILAINDNVRVRIIFAVTEHENDRNSIPVRHLLAIANDDDMGRTKSALDEWYLSKKKDYNSFASNWPVSLDQLQQDKQLKQMAYWCEEMEIRFTPTIFVNGYQLPNAYRISDIGYFLLD